LKNYTVRLYQSDDFALWNDFVSAAKNATFLFQRNFMEYHSDRFQDYSLLIFEDKKLVSLLPANIVDDVVFSHHGLTYGGFVFDEKIKLGQVLEIVKIVLKFLNDTKIKTLKLKLIPSIYNSYFSQEIEYAMFLTKATLYRRDCLSVVDLTKAFAISKTRRESINRGKKNALKIVEEPNFKLFWEEILIPNLDKKHNAKPVHTCKEMELLYRQFPNNIRHFNVYDDAKIVAGTTIFITDQVAHPQYISGNEQKNELGSIDYLYHHLITGVFKDKHFFDFGPSHENDGKQINQGILFWKESFGAKTVVQDWYEVETGNYINLESILQ
jgi:hypothetical protein